MLLDLRLAVRTLVKNPGFTALAVLTIALGIGVNTANFCLLESLIARPVELPGLDRLAMIQETEASSGLFNDQISPRAWLDLRDQSRSFDTVGAYQWWDVNLTGSGGLPEQVLAFQVSPEFFPMLGTPATLGRTFAPDEIDGQHDKVVVLSDRLWRRRYGADAGILGRAVVIDGTSYTVVGVMPRWFRFPHPAELWAPLTLTSAQRADRAGRYLGAIARLRPGVSLPEAHAEIAAMGQRYAREFPLTNAGRRMRAQSLARGVVEDTTVAFLWMLTVAAAFVLAIACANVASLLLARAHGRRKEMAVRAALGAGTWRVVRQLLTESLLLGAVAGLVSLLFAIWAVDFIKGAIPPTITRYIPGWERLGIDPAVLAFTALVALGAGVLAGLAPALHLARDNIHPVLKESGGTVAGSRGTHRLRGALVVAQVALALVLLVGAGVVVKGFMRTANPRRGLEPAGVLTMRLVLPDVKYGEPWKRIEFQQRALERLRALPGAEEVSASTNIPWGEHGGSANILIEGRPLAPAAEAPEVDVRAIAPGYHELLRIPLYEGRRLAASDDADTALSVAVVSQSTARTLFAGENPIGKRFRLGQDAGAPPITIVGVVGDVFNHFLRDPPPTVYVPYARMARSGMYLVVRTRGEPAALAMAARAAIATLDPELPVTEERPLGEVLAQRVSGIRLGSQMMGAFAALALALSVLGIYGVAAQLVAQRTHEIGIRMALGARTAHVLRLVVGQGAMLAAVGLVIGLPTALALVQTLRQSLSNIVDADMSVFVVLTVVVGAMALAGSLLPARRAARVDPMIALRSE